jgi:hypothetical protein
MASEPLAQFVSVTSCLSEQRPQIPKSGKRLVDSCALSAAKSDEIVPSLVGRTNGADPSNKTFLVLAGNRDIGFSLVEWPKNSNSSVENSGCRETTCPNLEEVSLWGGFEERLDRT